MFHQTMLFSTKLSIMAGIKYAKTCLLVIKSKEYFLACNNINLGINFAFSINSTRMATYHNKNNSQPLVRHTAERQQQFMGTFSVFFTYKLLV